MAKLKSDRTERKQVSLSCIDILSSQIGCVFAYTSSTRRQARGIRRAIGNREKVRDIKTAAALLNEPRFRLGALILKLSVSVNPNLRSETD